MAANSTLPLVAFAIIFLALPESEAQAQEQIQPVASRAYNAGFVEFGGNGLFLSVNYERFIGENIGLRIGTGTILFGTSVPIMINFYSSGDHKLESGFGIVYVNGEFFDEFEAIIFTSTIGYRFHPSKGGFDFRIGFTPVYNLDEIKFFPFGGMSLGVAF